MKNLPPPSDAELAEINKMLDWHAGTRLPDGRVLGRLEVKPGKRPQPQAIPDARIKRLNDLVGLKGKHVLEVGCFEGIHTAGLLKFGARVTAVDLRPQNVVKTLARLSYHGLSARVFQLNVEQMDGVVGRFDLIFHFGVLYHLAKPVEHIRTIAPMCTHLYLDTHIAPEDKRPREISVEGRTYQGVDYSEGGWADPFSGAQAKSFWLTRESLTAALNEAGFAKVDYLQDRAERNGPRVLLLASRDPS